MRQYLYFVLLSFLFISCYNTERDCKSFQTGKFEFETYLNGELVKTTFVRNDTLEIDFFEGKADSSSIRWINDCEYIANKLNPNSMMERKALHFKILSTSEDSYTFEYGIVGETKKQKGSVKKVSE
ncbi:DNA topoisomerase IV [Leeuwenhoekiella nanhaiensis]|uniref:DNA topoisomerase IV n=1 Tax=Leeuwenhoekiella nanhaiensis TaxID=1655491 RepID=A0A2G1VU09_9FLAO|nr:DNA topoisomerase IV [Leeuwenhoekiella nanhaiensis]PHQ30221.1 DNA topoisomerase IV [Leeuwenhoekiella nanhaiensis]